MRSALVVCLAMLLCVVPLGSSSGAEHQRAEGEKTYVRLFTQVADPVPQRTPKRLARTLARFFAHVHGEGSDPRWFALRNTSAGSELLKRGVWSSQYRNGSYTSQSTGPADPMSEEAASLERTDGLALNVFWPGRHREALPEALPEVAGAALRAPVGVGDTSLTLGVVPTDRRPPNSDASWPFLASTIPSPDGHSESTKAYVSWVRVGAELMKITAPPVVAGDTITLHVDRGLWNSDAASHETGAKVLAPVYVGSGFEGAGYPMVDDPSVALRYSYKFWKPSAYRWLADRILETLGSGRPRADGGRLVEYDTVWLDTSSCTQYNLSDAYGNRVWSWDQRTDLLMDDDAWGGYQRWKLNGRKNKGGGLRDLVRHADRDRRVKFVGNNFKKFGSSCDRALSREYDAIALEHWQRAPDGFEQGMRDAFRYQRINQRALFWVRWDRPGVPSPSTDAFQRYTYGAYLLAWRRDATRPEYGMTWGWSPPHALFRVDGDPATNGDFGVPRKARSLEDIRTKVPGLYRRNFSKGRVYVNVSGAPVTVRLARPFLRIGLGARLDGVETVDGAVTIPSLDAVFLRRTE